MDRNFDIDDFEQLLKERSDEFKMYPAKRVWYSIYNNIHPGRKWPSVATCITLIAVLLLVGYLNTGHKDVHLSAANLIQPGKTSLVNLSSLSFYNPFLEKNILDNQNTKAALVNNFTLINSTTLNNKPSGEIKMPATSIFLSRDMDIKEDKYAGDITGSATIADKYNLTAIEPITKNELPASATINNDLMFATINNKRQFVAYEKDRFVKNDAADIHKERKIQQEEKQLNEVITLIALSNLNDIQKNGFSLPNTSTNNDIALQEVNLMSDEDKAWVENYALYNRPAPKKWAGKLRSQFYITPSVVYRQLKNTITTEQDINNEVTQHPSFGLELGAGIMYPLSSWLKVKTGVQLNFTRYNASGFGNTHPVATSITMTTLTGQHYQVLRSSPYSNNEGIMPLQLHNETFQISLPVGMDVKLAGTDNLQWNIGATIQPAYVIGGKSYLISTDKRNYIKESDMLNRWNLDAGFETYISYKTSNGYTLQFGPQFRMQIFTTNKSQYSIQEKLTNYGIKFGISKLIK
jgi:hypothetical protein